MLRMSSMTICPRCYGIPYDDNGQPCNVCFGYGVVYPEASTCKRCQGKGCNHCFSGAIAVPMGFTRSATRYSKEDVLEAAQALRTGYEGEPTKATGLLAILTMISDQRVEESTDHGEWLRSILHNADAIVVDHSGIWLQHGERGIRIYAFPVE